MNKKSVLEVVARCRRERGGKEENHGKYNGGSFSYNLYRIRYVYSQELCNGKIHYPI